MMQQRLTEKEVHPPIVPFVRDCDYAVRHPWRSPERRLLDYLLVYVQEGECRFIVDGAVYRLQRGEFCLIQPGSLVDLEGVTDTITPYAHFDVFYNEERELSFPTRPGQIDLAAYRSLLQPRLDDTYAIQVPVRLKLRNPEKARDHLIQLIERWQEGTTIAKLKVQHLATEIILALLEEHLPHERAANSASPALNWITSYFSLHLSEPLSVQDMAERASLSPSRFSALFKRQYGVSPHQYLLAMRIRHAKELLETTDYAQEVVAEYCGFADIHHFSKAFKKNTGTTPGLWRKQKG